jgi:hypothetical protein
VDFAEFNNILHKLSSKELIFNLSTDELASVIFKFILVTSYNNLFNSLLALYVC